MEEFHPIVMLLVALNVLFSYKGFKDIEFFNRNTLNVDAVLGQKDYQRLLSSGFLHVSWMHVGLNMLALFLFGDALLYHVGWLGFLLIYGLALLGGNLLALWFHRNHGSYTAVGASGAVSGVLFASILLNPSMKVGLLFIPYHIAGWLFALLYVAYTLYGIQTQRDNIGHEAHLGGAIIGVVTALCFHPVILFENTWVVLAILIPISTFLAIIYARPEVLLIDSFSPSNQNEYSQEHQYNAQKQKKVLEIDDILDKIGRDGIHTLTKEERQVLDEYSKKK